MHLCRPAIVQHQNIVNFYDSWTVGFGGDKGQGDKGKGPGGPGVVSSIATKAQLQKQRVRRLGLCYWRPAVRRPASDSTLSSDMCVIVSVCRSCCTDCLDNRGYGRSHAAPEPSRSAEEQHARPRENLEAVVPSALVCAKVRSHWTSKRCAQHAAATHTRALRPRWQ